jgi:GDP/UDP-N,N'-diacetylbacillosamine 2-epimerase (hydrolysing)
LVFTATRADYGLLKPILRRVQESPALELILVAGGDHSSRAKGRTIDEITGDGFSIAAVIDRVPDSDSAQAIAASIGFAIADAAEIVDKVAPGLIVVLGDRYDLLPMAVAALLHRVPLAHIGGGESTEGALDEQVRHAMTKMSHLHFTSTVEYAHRLRMMGEELWRIHVVGAPGVENIRNGDFMNPAEIRRDFGVDVEKPVLLVTLHSETLGKEDQSRQVACVAGALTDFCGFQQVITYPGTEVGFESIVRSWEAYKAGRDNVFLVRSLGSRGYLGLMRHCSSVIGNSSSGIIEAPSLGVPTVNIGDRQKGRLRAASVIDVPYSIEAIKAAIQYATGDSQFRHAVRDVKNPYDPFGDGNVSTRIVDVLERTQLGRTLLEKKLDFPDHDEVMGFALS